MSDPTLDLSVGDRRRPLPEKWDGQPVTWDGWEFVWTTAALHAPPDCCPTCGDTRNAPKNSGRVHHPTYPYAPPRVLLLIAHRCPGCALDTVYEVRTGEWWTLDDSDYGPDGSTHP